MRADDLIVLLEIARCGSFSAASSALGVDHTTVSRRVAALERELKAPVVDREVHGVKLTALGHRLLGSGEQVEAAIAAARRHADQDGAAHGELYGLVRVATTEAFGTYIVTPVMADLHRQHPSLQVEIITQTRLNPYSLGADIEIGVGDPVQSRPGAEKLTDYRLGLYASAGYLEDRGTPTAVEDLSQHSLIYYVEGLLRVEDLDVLGRFTTAGHAMFGSTSVHGQLRATLCGAGIGLLPSFIAEQEPSLRRVLFHEVAVVPQFTACLASTRLRRPAAARVMESIKSAIHQRRRELLP